MDKRKLYYLVQSAETKALIELDKVRKDATDAYRIEYLKNSGLVAEYEEAKKHYEAIVAFKDKLTEITKGKAYLNVYAFRNDFNIEHLQFSNDPGFNTITEEYRAERQKIKEEYSKVLRQLKAIKGADKATEWLKSIGFVIPEEVKKPKEELPMIPIDVKFLYLDAVKGTDNEKA